MIDPIQEFKHGTPEQKETIMCDYSLHRYPNRLAVEGEDLVAYRFGGASLGLASPVDLGGHIASTRCQAAPRKFWSWARLKECFTVQRPEWENRILAVCVPPGARLLLRDIPKRAQRLLGVSGNEEVIFVETSAEVNTYRDAIQFKNGRRMLLQELCEGQRVTVLSLGTTEADRGVHGADIRAKEVAHY
jgi:hypothetical protein